MGCARDDCRCGDGSCVCDECECLRPEKVSRSRVLRRFVMRGAQLVEVGTVVRETR